MNLFNFKISLRVDRELHFKSPHFFKCGTYILLPTWPSYAGGGFVRTYLVRIPPLGFIFIKVLTKWSEEKMKAYVKAFNEQVLTENNI